MLAPMISDRRRSLAVWISSSSARILNWKAPLSTAVGLPSSTCTDLAFLPFLFDELQTPFDLFGLLGRNDAHFEQRLGVGNRALDIGLVHALIVLEGLVELVHAGYTSALSGDDGYLQGVSRAGEAAAVAWDGQ